MFLANRLPPGLQKNSIPTDFQIITASALHEKFPILTADYSTISAHSYIHANSILNPIQPVYYCTGSYDCRPQTGMKID